MAVRRVSLHVVASLHQAQNGMVKARFDLTVRQELKANSHEREIDR